MENACKHLSRSLFLRSLFLSSLLLIPLNSNANTHISEPKVHLEHEFAASDQLVWSKFGRFCSIEEWQSLVASCLVEEREDGVYRVVVMNDASAFVERLEAFSHSDKTFKYSILSGPLSIKNYQSELKVVALDEKRSKLIWRAWYDIPQDAKDITENLKKLFKNGLKGMDSIIDTATR